MLLKDHPVIREILSWVIIVAVAFVLQLIVKTFLIAPIRVDGPSMNDTLWTDEIMIVNKIQYIFGNPERGDVVICHFPNSTDDYVKRVIGLPGETVTIEAGVVHINGQPLDEPYVVHPRVEEYGPMPLGPGEYLCFGDNRADSKDSRVPSVGPITRENIVGHVIAVAWPVTSWRGIPSE